MAMVEEFLKALSTKINADSTLTTLLGGRVYMHVPEGASYPLVKLVLSTITRSETADNNGYKMTVRFNIFDRAQSGSSKSYLTAIRIADALDSLLHKTSGTTWSMTNTKVLMSFINGPYFLPDPDPLIIHGLSEMDVTVYEK